MNLWDAVVSLFRRKPKPALKPVAGTATGSLRASAGARVGKPVSGRAIVTGRASGEARIGSRSGEINAEIALP